MKYNQWIVLILAIIIVYNAWKSNKSNEVSDSAPAGKYSSQSSYKNVSAMKHDMFKQFTVDVVPYLLVNLSLTSPEFFSVDNFENTVIGKTLLAGVAYAFFHQIIPIFFCWLNYNLRLYLNFF